MQMPFPTVGPRPWRLERLLTKVPETWARAVLSRTLRLIPSHTIGPRSCRVRRPPKESHSTGANTKVHRKALTQIPTFTVGPRP